MQRDQMIKCYAAKLDVMGSKRCIVSMKGHKDYTKVEYREHMSVQQLV